MPTHVSLNRSNLDHRQEAEAEDRSNMQKTMGQSKDYDFVVIDTPGNVLTSLAWRTPMLT